VIDAPTGVPALVCTFPLASGLVTLVLPPTMSATDYDRLRSVLDEYLTLSQPALVLGGTPRRASS
jgi:hypothetical protein